MDEAYRDKERRGQLSGRDICRRDGHKPESGVIYSEHSVTRDDVGAEVEVSTRTRLRSWVPCERCGERIDVRFDEWGRVAYG